MKSDCKIFLITLRDYPERLAAFQKQVGQWRLNYEIVNGIEGYKLGKLKRLLISLPRLLMLKPPLSPGLIGCSASHMRIFKKMVDEDIQYALILEDDAFFCRALTSEIINRFDPGRAPFDIFFLGYNEYDYRDFTLGPVQSFGSMEGRKIHGHLPYGTVGSIVHRRMAIKRISEPFYIEEPIDHYWRYGVLDAFVAMPRLLSPNLDLFSVIRAKVRGNGSTQNIVINRPAFSQRQASLRQKIGNVVRILIIGSGLALVFKHLQARCLDL